MGWLVYLIHIKPEHVEETYMTMQRCLAHRKEQWTGWWTCWSIGLTGGLDGGLEKRMNRHISKIDVHNNMDEFSSHRLDKGMNNGLVCGLDGGLAGTLDYTLMRACWRIGWVSLLVHVLTHGLVGRGLGGWWTPSTSKQKSRRANW